MSLFTSLLTDLYPSSIHQAQGVSHEKSTARDHVEWKLHFAEFWKINKPFFYNWIYWAASTYKVLRIDVGTETNNAINDPSTAVTRFLCRYTWLTTAFCIRTGSFWMFMKPWHSYDSYLERDRTETHIFLVRYIVQTWPINKTRLLITSILHLHIKRLMQN